MELQQTTRSFHRLAVREIGIFDRPSDGVATWDGTGSDSGNKNPRVGDGSRSLEAPFGIRHASDSNDLQREQRRQQQEVMAFR